MKPYYLFSVGSLGNSVNFSSKNANVLLFSSITGKDIFGFPFAKNSKRETF